MSNPKKQIKLAIQLLHSDPQIKVKSIAPLYQTPAWGVTNQADFINTAITIDTSYEPQELLSALKTIEYNKMCRVENQRWHQRIIDIDILLYGTQYITEHNLIIPHRLIHERWFVILPLLALGPTIPFKLAQLINIKLQTEEKPAKIRKTP